MASRLFALFTLLFLACGAQPEPEEDEDLLAHSESDIAQLRQELGGVAVDGGWGWEDGITDIIPASGDRFYWYPYNSGVNDETWDTVSVAMASLDAEVTSLRLPHYKPTKALDADEVLLSVSIKTEEGAVPVECTDSGPGTPCTLGMAQCLAVVTSGRYDLCSHYRVNLYWGRIIANTAVKHPGEDPFDVLHDVTRHEVTHTFGFKHGDGGPMIDGQLPLTECQIHVLETYNPQPDSNVWHYEPKGC